VFGYFWFIHEIEEPVTAADRAVLITAEQVAKFEPGFRPDPALGKFRKVRHLDGSRELTYEFETPDRAEQQFYIHCLVGVEPTASDAKDSYADLRLEDNSKSVVHNAQAPERLDEVERNDLWRWGDSSRCMLLKYQGVEVGNHFMARKGRRYFSLVITGVCFDRSEVVAELLAPLLSRLENYDG
jgi:hypothetical protein